MSVARRLTLNDLLMVARSAAPQLSFAEASSLVGRPDVTFLDVRTEEEYQRSAIKGAIFAPRHRLEYYASPDDRRYVEDLDKEGQTIVVYCAGGSKYIVVNPKFNCTNFPSNSSLCSGC